MIYVSQKSNLNIYIANKLKESYKIKNIFYPIPKPDFKNINDTELLIVDLSADGTFQNLTSPELLAKELVNEFHLPNSVNTIKIFVSDINYENRLSDFCHKLELELDALEVNVVVKAFVASEPEKNLLFIVPPPQKSNNWNIYEISIEDVKKLGLTFTHNYKLFLDLSPSGIEKLKLKNFAKLLNCSEKKLIWSGEDFSNCQFTEKNFYKKSFLNH